MKIHSILLTKNEDDVIGHCLREAMRWSDYIYVYDGLSTDATWDIVQSMAGPQVVPFKQDGKVFSEGLRAEVFDAYRGRASEDDWWCQLNADEFYIDDPKQFLSRVRASRQVVWGLFVQYYLTPVEVDTLDFSKPCEDVLPQLRHYRADWAERRFFRHRARLEWDHKHAWPRHLGVSEENLIRFKHFPYRSPRQIQTRLDVRRNNRERGFEGWDTAKDLSWKEKIVPVDGLDVDHQDGNYINRVKGQNHVDPAMRRLMQHTMRRLGVWP
jgi:hypothetical protein